MERCWYDQLLGSHWTRLDGPDSWRCPAVRLPVARRDAIYRVGIRRDIRGLLGREQSEEHARGAGIGGGRPGCSGVWDAGISGRCGGHVVLMGAEQVLDSWLVDVRTRPARTSSCPE